MTSFIEELFEAEPEEIAKVINTREGVYQLVKDTFEDESGDSIELTSYQCEIVKRLLTKNPSRNLIWSTTRAGKSFALGLGSLLLAVVRRGEKIRLIGPTSDQAQIIMDYVQEHASDNGFIVRQVDNPTTGRLQQGDKLKSELSKTRITFRNDSEISVHTADIRNDGNALLGEGGSTVIVDEAERIPASIIRNRVLRMTGDAKNSQTLMISNPTTPDKRGFMFDNMGKDMWSCMRVGWEDAVREDRLTKDFVMQQKNILTPAEFKIMYEAEYPDDFEEGTFKLSKIREAAEKNVSMGSYQKDFSIDVAGEGSDKTVLSEWHNSSEFKKLVSQKSWKQGGKSLAPSLISEIGTDANTVLVDEKGVGKGLLNELKRKLEPEGVSVAGVDFGAKPKRDTDNRFRNFKAEMFWNARTMLNEGEVVFDCEQNTEWFSKLKNQLVSMKHEFSGSRQKIKMVDPKKSPDYADSFVIGLALDLINPSAFVLDGSSEAFNPMSEGGTGNSLTDDLNI